MVYDFVMDLNVIDPQDPVCGSMINECALILGIDDYYCFRRSRKKLEMVKKDVANRRLKPLVEGMLHVVESNHSDYSWKTRRVIEMVREYYGIGVRPMNLAKIARKKGISIDRAVYKIKQRMDSFSRSRRFVPWNYLFVAALYLPTEEYRKFCAALREKDAEMMRYKDLSPIYKCMNAK